MYDQLARLAYSGQWKNVIALLNKQPDLVNAASTGKGYTPLHQAAWHGVDLSVIGALLALGSDRRLLTKEGQTARDIARSRHPGREDLHYILSASTLSPAQLLRKLIAETPGLFSDYDGNRIICDRLITCLGETWDEDNASVAGDAARALPIDLDVRLEAAIQAITGLLLPPHGTARFVPANHFTSAPAPISCAILCCRRSATSPAELPSSRSSRIGRYSPICSSRRQSSGACEATFSWMELRQVLSHCELSDLPDRDPGCGVGDRLASAVASLIGAKVGERRDVYVRRYARGGMSSGRVSCDYWHQTVIPLFVRRAGWLRQSWVGLGPNAA